MAIDPRMMNTQAAKMPGKGVGAAMANAKAGAGKKIDPRILAQMMKAKQMQGRGGAPMPQGQGMPQVVRPVPGGQMPQGGGQMPPMMRG